MKKLDTFYAELKAAGALTAEFAKAVKNGTVDEFLKANDVDATAEEFLALSDTEMTDEQLDAVAGGANKFETLLSICSLGFACAIMAAVSAAGDGVGDGKNGTLLCNDESWGDAAGRA